MSNPRNNYQGKLVVITGGSSGIGLALARLLADEGANVQLMARHVDKLEAACRSLSVAPGQAHGFVPVDVTDWPQVQAAVERLTQQAGVPDVLINAVGGAHPGYLQEIPVEVFHTMMGLNYFGHVHTVKAILPGMLARGSGHIVNFSSEAGFLTPFGYGPYVPAKYAARGFSDALRLELKPLGIRVSVVFPPDTDTPGFANENKTKPFETRAAFSNSNVLPADVVAKSILHGLQRGHYVILPGTEINLHYRLMFLVGDAVYPLFDSLLSDARRKKKRS